MRLPGFSLLRRPRAVAALVFVLAGAFAALQIQRLQAYRAEQQRALVAGYAADHALALQAAIERALSANYALAALLRQGRGEVRDFDTVVAQMLPLYPGVSHMLLAPGGVITQVSPLAGNAAAIGVDVLHFPPQQKEAMLSRDTGRLTLAGPLALVQGGSGLVGRLPVFFDDAGGQPAFWGFTGVVMRLPEALRPARLAQLPARGLQYELWRVHPEGGERQIIEASSATPLIEPVQQSLAVPNGAWSLSVAPTAGWGDALSLWLQVAAGALFSVLLAGFAKLLVELRLSKRSLQSQLEERTAQSLASRRRLEATFNAIPDMIWLKDPAGRYLDCNPQFERLYGQPREQILGKNDYDFCSQAVADAFRDNDRKAVLARGPRANEEWVTLSGSQTPMLLETVKTPLFDSDGELLGVLGIARDITSRKRDEQALRESQTRLAVALEATEIGIWDWDLTHDQWLASPTYFTMLGYEPQEGPLDRAVWLERLHPDDHDEPLRRIADVLRGSEVAYQYEARLRHADGHYRWCSIRGKVVARAADGLATRLLGVRIDIHDLKTAEERIHWLAHYDLLTGLPNRTLLNTRLQHALDTARRNQTGLALLLLDLDRFKNINDTLGHRVGDALLVMLAQRMRAVLREEDLLARQGGDEFIVLLQGADANGAAHVAQKLLEAIAQPCQIDAHELVVTPSMGISVHPDDAADLDGLFTCADTAMYRAKHGGRNSYRFFTPEMQQRSARVLRLENALRRALERGEFWLCYQPQVSLVDGRIIGAEALLRWQQPELGAVSPGEFISIAEDSGQILEIGEWVLRTAARQLKRWMDSGLPPMTMAVNLSAVQFRHPDLLKMVTRIVEETGLPAQHLELELTESVAMDNPQAAIAVMNQLHEREVLLSIDDFGTGYSSLSYLKRLKVYKLKIDQSFVRNIADHPEDRVIIGAIIGLASSLGLQTIAEGVETEAQLQFLREHGCNQAQGYWFSKPLPVEGFEAFVRERMAGQAACVALLQPESL